MPATSAIPDSPSVSAISEFACFVLVGSVSSISSETTVCRRTFCVSTSGVSPVTVIVSSTAPTCMSAFTVAVKPAVSTIPSRRKPVNPGSENVTVYVPGRRSTML